MRLQFKFQMHDSHQSIQIASQIDWMIERIAPVVCLEGLTKRRLTGAIFALLQLLFRVTSQWLAPPVPCPTPLPRRTPTPRLVGVRLLARQAQKRSCLPPLPIRLPLMRAITWMGRMQRPASTSVTPLPCPKRISRNSPSCRCIYSALKR